MWVGNGSGILRLDPSEIDKVAGEPGLSGPLQAVQHGGWRRRVPFGEGSRSGLRSLDGRLWFVTSSGVTIVDPRNLGESPAAPSVGIESIAADARAFNPAGPLQLPARTSHLQIGFTALTLSDRCECGIAIASMGTIGTGWMRRSASGHLYEPAAAPVSVSGHGERGDGTWVSRARR